MFEILADFDRLADDFSAQHVNFRIQLYITACDRGF
jgi:hypothetical protein